MTYDEIIKEVSSKLGLSKTLVDRTYKSYWKVIRNHITSLPLKDDLTDEEFMQLQPNVNVPSLGKLYVTLRRYRGKKKNFDFFKDSYKGNKYKQDNNATH